MPTLVYHIQSFISVSVVIVYILSTFKTCTDLLSNFMILNNIIGLELVKQGRVNKL